MANIMEPDQTAPIVFASILDWSVMLGNYLQQTIQQTTFSDVFFFLGALRVNEFLRRAIRARNMLQLYTVNFLVWFLHLLTFKEPITTAAATNCAVSFLLVEKNKA